MQTFKKFHNINGILRSGNNLAMTLYGVQDFAPAFEQILQSLEAAQKWDRKHDLLNISCTAAQISIDMGNLDQAEEYLLAAFSNAEVLENTFLYHVFVLMEWARLSMLRDEMKPAKSYLLQAIVVAEENDQLAEQTQCHKLLMDIYKKEGDEKKAQLHANAYQIHNEQVEMKRAANRLAIQAALRQVS